MLDITACVYDTCIGTHIIMFIYMKLHYEIDEKYYITHNNIKYYMN